MLDIPGGAGIAVGRGGGGMIAGGIGAGAAGSGGGGMIAGGIGAGAAGSGGGGGIVIGFCATGVSTAETGSST